MEQGSMLANFYVTKLILLFGVSLRGESKVAYWLRIALNSIKTPINN